MNNLLLEEIWYLVKRVILWIIINIIFMSRELRTEAYNQLFTGSILIPGVFYGLNLVQGFQSIKKLFPECHRRVQLDYVLGYLKSFLLIACALGLFLLVGIELS
jgi:hypothetical protein